MAVRALHARRDVAHVRELDMIGDLVDSIPGNRFLPLEVSSKPLDLLRVLTSRHELMTAHAGCHGRDPRPHGSLGREMAILAVDLVLAGVDIMGERDGLAGGPHLFRSGLPLRLLWSSGSLLGSRGRLLSRERRRPGEHGERGGGHAGTQLHHGTSLPDRLLFPGRRKACNLPYLSLTSAGS